MVVHTSLSALRRLSELCVKSQPGLQSATVDGNESGLDVGTLRVAV